MNASTDVSDLLKALCAARSAFPTIVRNQKATARGGREYQYANLSAIADSMAPVLAQHGLMLVQGIEDGENGQLCIRSTLYHTSGQWMGCALSVPKPTSMQEVGSLSTYIRRYQASAVLFLATEDDDDAASTAGATTEPKAKSPASPAPSNGHQPMSETSERPTEAHLAALRNLAVTECQEPVDVFEDRIRQTLKIPKHASVAPKLLTRTMSMDAYIELFNYYRRLEAQLAKGKEVSNGSAPPPQTPPEPTPAPPEETSAPFEGASSSAGSANPEVDAAERNPAYHKLFQEALGWGIPEREITHILNHHDLAAARGILWKARKEALIAHVA